MKGSSTTTPSAAESLQALKVVRWRLISQEKSQYLSLRKRLLTFARKREREFLRRRKAFLMISQRIGRWRRRGIIRRFFVRLMLRKEQVVVLLVLQAKNRVGCTSFFFWQGPLREAEGKRHLSPLIRGHFSPIGGDITASIDYKRRWSLP